MSEEFYKDSKTDIAEQLNAKNGTHITADNITLGIVNGDKAIVGDNVKYSQSAAINLVPRDLGALIGYAPIIVTDMDFTSGSVKVKDIIPLVNKSVGTNISVGDIMNAEFVIPKPITGGPAVVVNFNGNRVSMVNDFNVILVKKDFNFSDWAALSTNHEIGWLGTDTARNYRFEPDKFSTAMIQNMEDVYVDTCQFAILGEGSPMFLLALSDADKFALKWPDNIQWVESDVRDFSGSMKFYLFTTQNKGQSYRAMRINGDEPWEELVYKIQGRSIDDRQVEYLLDGHVKFLKNNTGKIVDPHTDHFVINEKDVLVNNRHFTYNTRQEGQPDSDATTEGHSLLITGFIEAYRLAKSRGNTLKAAEYLAAAEKYFISYIEAFYAGELPPDTPFRWSSNWIVNGKSPVLAHYPLADANDFPTHGGFIDIAIPFVNGVGKVAAGAPYWGEYLDVVGKVYKGNMGWKRIDAKPYLQVSDVDDSLDWKSPAPTYEVESIHTWSMEIISGDGDKIGTFTDESLKGTITLKDKTLNSELNASFAARLPVEHGGYMLATNECQHNRPLQVPVNNLFRGNASDAEQWFCEAAYDLWKITGDDLYKKSFEASLWTIMEYTTIDANDKFFRKVKGDARYDTDGITYYYTYPSKQPVKIDRNADGYIRIRSERAEGLQFTMEQNAIPFRVNRNSVLQLQYGGIDDKQGLVNARAQLVLSIDKSKEKEKVYNIPLPPTMDSLPVEVNIPIGSLVEITDNDPFELMAASAISWSENTKAFQKFDSNVFDGRTASVLHAQATADGDMQFSVGLSKKRIIISVIYRANIDMNIRIIDADGWRWWAMLPASSEWVGTDYAEQSWTLASYQTNPETDPRPTAVNWNGGVDEVTFLPDGSSKEFDYIDLYTLNDLPPTYAVDDGYTVLFGLTFYMDAPATVYLGDCTIKGQRLDALPYTPGIIPFSNNSVPNAPTFDSWRGQPYPGYQYPFYYALQTLEENPNRDLMISNVIDFWYDSQQWYHQQFGVMGPGASAYVWDRWDMPDGETPNTWTMYHFGTNVAWSGYQPRAFYAAVKMYETMRDQKMEIPDKLVTYIKNWLLFLRDFVEEHDIVPSDYPVDKAPEPLENDFTGHMSGLYLAGISKAYMLGLRIPGHIGLARAVYQEIVDNYVQRPGYEDIMNGAWSPFADPANNGKDGMFFGFWAGEIMRGISIYAEFIFSIFPREINTVRVLSFQETLGTFDVFKSLAAQDLAIDYNDVTTAQVVQMKKVATAIFSAEPDDDEYVNLPTAVAGIVYGINKFGAYGMDEAKWRAIAASFTIKEKTLAASGNNHLVITFSDNQDYPFVSDVTIDWTN